MTNYTQIKRTNTEQTLKSAVTDVSALHMLLSSPNLPEHLILYDGNKFEMFNAYDSEGYAKTKTPYKGYVDKLELCTWINASCLDLPFKVRDVDASDTVKFNFGQYLRNKTN